LTDSDYIFAFLKFGNETDMLDLLNNGTIYMNPINKFRVLEDNNLRGDNYEGVQKIWNLPAGKFEIPKINFKGNYIRMHLRESYEKILGNIYSLYSINSGGFAKPSDFYIDERVKEFGSHFVAINNIVEFRSRIVNALKLLGHNFHCDFVQYYDKNQINGQITVFHKPNEFQYQREYRFYVDRPDIFPLSFKIGNLKDIASIHSSDQIKEITASVNTSS
jgi:hypothetical protein